MSLKIWLLCYTHKFQRFVDPYFEDQVRGPEPSAFKLSLLALHQSLTVIDLKDKVVFTLDE